MIEKECAGCGRVFYHLFLIGEPLCTDCDRGTEDACQGCGYIRLLTEREQRWMLCIGCWRMDLALLEKKWGRINKAVA